MNRCLPPLRLSLMAVVLAAAGASHALAQTTSPASTTAASTDDSLYDSSPFSPTPAAQLRDFSPDRPGKTHSPTSVDVGHVQMEADFYNYSFSKTNDSTTRQWSTPNALVKWGVTDWADLEVQTPGYSHYEYRDRHSGQITKAQGRTDVWAGTKINIFGNDPGDGPSGQALAIIPFVKIPTASKGLGNSLIEAQIAIPYQISLPDKFTLVVENIDGLRDNAVKHGYHGEFEGALNLGHPLFSDNLVASVEYVFNATTDNHLGRQHSVGGALQWYVTKGLALDVGDDIGLNSKTTGENPYAGVSVRF